MSSTQPIAIVLAAGKGTRMASDLPKVCHPVGGRPMVCAVVDACLEAGCEKIIAVVGYKEELVREALAEYGETVQYARQDEQNGTGHAVRCATVTMTDDDPREPVFVLCGDGPLIRTSTLESLLDRHLETKAGATLATAVVDDPTGYGRIVRGEGGGFARIVEQKNASEDELRINEINPSYYCFRLTDLREGLAAIRANETTGEEYITDVPEILLKLGRVVEVVDAVPAEDVLSINTPEQLAEVDAIFRARRDMTERDGAHAKSGGQA